MKDIENVGNELANERLEKFRRFLGIEKRENAEGRNFLLRQTGYALRKWKKDFPETAAEFEKRFP